MATAYDDLPDGLVIADADAVVTVVNPAAERLLGTRADDLVGKHVGEGLGLRDEEGREWWACVRPYDGLETRTRLVESAWFDLRGNEVLVTANLVREHRCGQLTSLVLSLRDAGVRRRADRSRSDLVATVAHELRSPLTGVKGFTSTLLAKWDRFSESQRRLMLETVDADADRLTRLIGELLDVARIDSGRLQLRRQPVDIAAEVEKITGRYTGSDSGPITMHVERVPEVWVDPDKLAQVVINLLDNAGRHGAGKVELGIGPGTTHEVDLWVQDEGPGIPEDLRERVFAKFWRHGSRTGTGLGLFIVRGLVEAHGGTVWVETAETGGARLRLSLPVGRPEVMDDRT
ncbi:MAG TPA: ATP-binding protein [Nocardioidaceae bacterium]|nr:ATP-binding protein [Nocardioidaceae bacterium]